MADLLSKLLLLCQDIVQSVPHVLNPWVERSKLCGKVKSQGTSGAWHYISRHRLDSGRLLSSIGPCHLPL